MAVLDEPALLEGVGDEGDAGAGDAEQVADVLVREGQGAVAVAVGAEEQPAGEALLDGVVGVATGGLRGLEELVLEGAERQIVEVRAAAKLEPGRRARKP